MINLISWVGLLGFMYLFTRIVTTLAILSAPILQDMRNPFNLLAYNVEDETVRSFTLKTVTSGLVLGYLYFVMFNGNFDNVWNITLVGVVLVLRLLVNTDKIILNYKPFINSYKSFEFISLTVGLALGIITILM